MPSFFWVFFVFVQRRWRKAWSWGAPKLHPLLGELAHAMSPVGVCPFPPQSGQESGNLDTLNPCFTPSSSWGMGPGGRRPSRPSAEGQMAPTSGLMNRRASHLLQNLVSLPRLCEGPSGCNGAARLGLQSEDRAPTMQWGLVCPGTS